MKRNLNRRKFTFFRIKNIIYFIILLLFLILIVFTNYQKNFFLKIVNNSIEEFSKNFQYQYINLNVSGLVKVEYSFLENKLKKYLNSSIFLLPLDEITMEIRENNWIKSVNLSTNYRDTLFVSLEEYKPLGIYSFNDRKFYFDNKGKIIDEVKIDLSDYKNFIVFYGKSSNLKAKIIIDLMNSLNFQKKFNIKSIHYIEKRRWDILLNNNTKLMLSENSPKKSLQNFINIEKNLSKADINNIKRLDLRNTKKTLITYNK